MLEKTVRMGLLFDYYGQLLTDRQREFFSLYYNDDLSLGEIAQQYGVSRQAVYDILRRSSQSLEGLESKLELVKRFQDQQESWAEIDSELDAALKQLRLSGAPKDALDRIERAREALTAWQ